MDEPVIECRGVVFSYGGPPTLEDVNLRIDEREAVCIVGPNGGGKTTLVRLILGLLEPDAGEIRVFGRLPRLSRHRVGYMPQHVQHDPRFPSTVMDVVLMGRLGHTENGRRPTWFQRLTGWPTKLDRRAALNALEQVEMADCAAKPFTSLSGGQRQRVLIARALTTSPDLLLLDEPTSNVDAASEDRLLKLLKELNRRMTIVMVSHDLGFVTDFVDRVICVNRRVVAHPTSEVTSEAVREIYGGEIRQVRHDEIANGKHLHV